MSNKRQKRELGTIMLAVSGAVMVNLAVNGLGYLVRGVIWVFMLALFAIGVLLVKDDFPEVPIVFRSRGWARREAKRIVDDKSHRLYGPYWKNKGYENITEEEHRRVVAFVAALNQRSNQSRATWLHNRWRKR